MVAHETSGATTRLILGYVRERAGADAVADVLRRADVPHTLVELEDESRWVSYDTRIRLFDAAVAVLGDPRAPYKMGAESLRAGMNASLVLLLRALGSPRQVYRQLPRAVPKFTTTSTMEVVESGATHATLRYRLHDGYTHSRFDCAYAQGLIAVVPEIFGLPPATLVHDECESDGYPACVYHLTWARRRRFPWRRGETGAAADGVELVALRSQLEALQSAASDLVSSDDLTAVLRRITQRAAAAVLAPSYLLALHDPDGGEPLVHAEGLDADRAATLGARLLAGDDLGPGAVVVDVASSRRLHGRLAALYAPGQRGPANERSMLAAYAGHAAAALDLLMALERSRRGESRSAALLTLAHELRAATDPETVGQAVVTAMRRIAACQSVSVMLWDPAAGELRPVACDGLPEREHELFMASAVRVEETPELAGLLMRQEPTVIDAEAATPLLREYLRAIGVDDVIAVPLLAGGELLGAATVSWGAGRRPAGRQELLARLQGVGEYAAAALENVRLLGTVRHQSLHDALTGLPNRVLFARHLERTLREAGTAGGTAVLFCDLDRFKHVNDVLGHAAGDELLRQVAARLRGVLRTSDMVGRLSGDEFALLLPGVTDPLAAEDLGLRVVASFADPFRVEGREVRVTTSVGVALHTGADGRADLLIRAADGAMYEAKQRGRNQVAVAPEGVRTGAVPSADGHPSLEAELQAALAGEGLPGEGLRLFFMPVVEATRTGLGLAGAEALVRWAHPRLGLLPPGAFLPLAEEAGLIAELDLWAVGAACEAAVSWPVADGEPLHVAVNLAADTLLDPRLLSTVRGALARHGLAPDRLHLEVVESRSLVDLAGVIERLAELRRLGVRISLDDFGTGYSTLAWLQRLPVDQVKIDRSFVQGLPGDAASLAVVRGVLALARELGLEVVAEGVETAEQLVALRDAGCSLVQGYLLGAPAPGTPALDPRALALEQADRPARGVQLVAA